VASREDKEAMFLAYNSFDSGATTKITIHNRRLIRAKFEGSILIPSRQDDLDMYREEYNQMLLEKSVGENGIFQEKYKTVSIFKLNVKKAPAQNWWLISLSWLIL